MMSALPMSTTLSTVSTQQRTLDEGIRLDPTKSTSNTKSTSMEGPTNSAAQRNQCFYASSTLAAGGSTYVQPEHFIRRKAHFIGFLPCRGNGPAFDPCGLLLRAGDVERNPGPEVCQVCQKRLQRNHLVCEESGCDAKSHKKRKCSELRKGQIGWRCREHRVEVEVKTCDQCRSEIPTKGSRRVCSVAVCERICHCGQKCSKIGRYGRSKTQE